MPQLKKWKKWFKRIAVGLPLMVAVGVGGWSNQIWVRQLMVMFVLLWYPTSMLFDLA